MSSLDPVYLILDRLSGVKQHGEQFIARCPAHEDRTPSLSVRRGDDGRALIHCFAGCEPETVLDAIGLTFDDLFPPREPEERKTYAKIRSRKELLDVLSHELIVLESFLWTAQRVEPAAEDLERGRLSAARIKQVMDKIGG